MTAPPQGDRQQARDLQGIPLRGILIGAVLALVPNICDTYSASNPSLFRVLLPIPDSRVVQFDPAG